MFILWHRVFLVFLISGYYSIIRVQLMRLVKSYCFPKLPISKYHHFLGDVLLIIIEILFFFLKIFTEEKWKIRNWCFLILSEGMLQSHWKPIPNVTLNLFAIKSPGGIPANKDGHSM